MRHNNSLNLPDGWILTTLGEIITFEYGKGLRKDLRDPNGKIPVYGSNGVVGYHSIPLVKKPCIIVGRKGTSGAVHISKVPCWPIDTTYYIDLPEELDLDFIYHLLSTLKLDSFDRSTAIPGLNRDDIYGLEIPLPSLKEQKRISFKIEELFTKLDLGIKYLTKTKEQLKQYSQSVLKYAFDGKLTENWREKNKDKIYFDSKFLKDLEKLLDKEPLDFNKLSHLPPLWKWVKLRSIDDVTMGQSPPGNSYNINGKGMPLLNGPTEFGKQYPIPTQWTTKVTKISEKEDLLICVRGNTTGRMNWSDQRYCIGRGLAAIRPKFYEINSKILFFFLKMKTKELLSNTTGSTFPNLTKDKLNEFHFPLIPPNEQNYIVEDLERQFSLIDNIEKIVTQNLVYLIKLKASILKTAFEGKLIPQEPTDEHASILLEKIKKEKYIIKDNHNLKINMNKSDSKQ